jgi:predicted ATP-grasp superfamily ATP-dependent carboligase
VTTLARGETPAIDPVERMEEAPAIHGGSRSAAARNPLRAERDWPAAVIAGAYRTGVLGVRSLLRRGVNAMCFDSDRRQSGFRSTYARARQCPDPDTNPTEWLTFMVEYAAEICGRPVLIPSADKFVSAIATHAGTLADHFIVSPGIRVQGALATKQTQYELAPRHGMPMPRTRLVKSIADVTSFANSAQFPCLLKPLHFREWQAFPDGHPLSHAKIAIAGTDVELVHAWTMASAVNVHTIAQEIIQGPDTDKRVYLACYDRTGKRIANAMFRELRCNPMMFGPASVTEPVVDEETDAICDSFLRSLGYSGICEIEMKRDARDGKVKLIEANPRLTGGGDAAPYAGVDLCWLHYLDMIGKTANAVMPDGKDFRHIDLRADVGAIFAYRRAGLIAWREVIQSYKSPRAFFDFDAHDWRYSGETIYQMARSFARELIRPPKHPA